MLVFFLSSFSGFASDDTQFSAFGTIGLVTSDSSRYGYRNDVSYHKGVYSGDIDFLNHSLLGVQLDKSLSSDVDFVGQAVIRDLADPKFERYITLGFLRYAPSANWQLRIGRTAPDIFLITEYRDVGVAYIWATPPNEVYGMIPFRSLDGADVAYSTHLGDGTLRAKVFTGQAESVISSAYSVIPIELKNIFGLSINFSTIDWSIQAQHTQVKLANEAEDNQQIIDAVAQMPPFIWPDAKQFSESLALKGKHASYTSISGQAYLGNFLLTAELAQITSNDTDVIPKLLSGYGSLAYQLGEHTLYSVYAFTDSDSYTFDEPGVKTQLIPELISGVESMNNFYASSQQTISIGWRWDFSDNISSSLQWNNTHIDDLGGALWLNDSADLSADTINVLMLSVSFSL